MNSRQLRVFASLRRALATLAQRSFDIPEIASNRADLEVVYARIAELYGTQKAERPWVDGAQVQLLRKDLRVKYMLRISRRAELLLDGLPGVKEDFRVPHAKASIKDLVDAAARIAEHYRTHADSFNTVGFPKDLVKKMEKTAKALEDRSANTDTAMNRRSHATSSLPEDLARGRKIIRSIDATVRSEFAAKRDVIKIWDKAKRIQARIGRPKRRRRPPNDSL